MPPKRDFDRIFLPFTVAVEKKIKKLALFIVYAMGSLNVTSFD
jgi:hypothetical protein